MAGKKNDVREITRSGYERLSEELTNLRTVGRLEVAKKLEEARAFGDLSENAEYAAAKEEQAKLEDRIHDLEETLSKVTVIDEEKLDTTRAGIGLSVTLKDLDHEGKLYTYEIVGSEELSGASVSSSGVQRISQKSPVGQAVLGHAIGEEVIVRIPRGTRRLRIMAIEK
ncbi:MAG: transcription elongation factor GreA [Synergistaceae bacterium]|nr:transcription elongation factor GreA [Synergistaceae bacterium]MBQ3397290.1 transcription elongation factor GreA [Synergistaceae bacterium]MBQ3759362.1 transcription elongation factor GreA [Synergistaceae bacterium]MBQ6002157.1 transcription elongation factor GreA [Synergistaceae bacterium]MBQ6418077.1 transcription elongation factor GreA [Synergistaceae bacterium]